MMWLKVDTQDIFFKVRKNEYKVKIDGLNLFEQPLKNDIRTYHKNRKFIEVKKMTTQLVAY